MKIILKQILKICNNSAGFGNKNPARKTHQKKKSTSNKKQIPTVMNPKRNAK